MPHGAHDLREVGNKDAPSLSLSLWAWGELAAEGPGGKDDLWHLVLDLLDVVTVLNITGGYCQTEPRHEQDLLHNL